MLAVGMVVGSLVLRSRMDKSSRTLRLTCVEELADACQQLDRATVTVESAGTTADRLTALGPGEDPGFDGWLTVGPWPEMVDIARQNAAQEPLFTRKDAVAWSPLAVLVETQRAAALKTHCPPPAWVCIATAAGRPWSGFGLPATFGQVKENLPDPVLSSDGVAVLGAISDDLFKDAEFDVHDDRLRGLLAGLKKSAQTKAPATVAMGEVLTAPAITDVADGSEADALSILRGAANQNGATVLYPAAVKVGVVFGQIGDSAEARDLAELVRGSAGTGSLTAANWKSGAPATGTTTDPGELAALRAAWRE